MSTTPIAQYEDLCFEYELVSSLLGKNSDRAVEIRHKMGMMDLAAYDKRLMDNLTNLLNGRDPEGYEIIDFDEFDELPEFEYAGNLENTYGYIFQHCAADILQSRAALGSLVEITTELGMFRFSNTLQLLVGDPTEYVVEMREEHLHRVVVRTYSPDIAKVRAAAGVGMSDDLGMEFEQDLTSWNDYYVQPEE